MPFCSLVCIKCVLTWLIVSICIMLLGTEREDVDGTMSGDELLVEVGLVAN